MGKTLRRAPEGDRGRRLAAAALSALALLVPAGLAGQDLHRIERGRFTVVAHEGDERLAQSLLRVAIAADSFPGLPAPRRAVMIQIAPDERRFREWIGPQVPEWGAAVAFPAQQRIVMQGSSAGSDADFPPRVLRHELAHLALHEYLGDLPPRWFDEGYASFAAGEWGREEVLATNVALAFRGVPTFAGLDSAFRGGTAQAATAYALAHRAVADMAAIDPAYGLERFFRYWKETGSFELGVKGAFTQSSYALERDWRRRTRMRYGALAVVTDLSLAGLFLMFVLVPLYVARRRRQRRRYEALVRADEEAERRERASAIEALLRSLPPSAPPAAPPSGEPH